MEQSGIDLEKVEILFQYHEKRRLCNNYCVRWGKDIQRYHACKLGRDCWGDFIRCIPTENCKKFFRKIK